MIDKFLPLVMEAEEEGAVSPIVVHNKVTFVYIKHNNVYSIQSYTEFSGVMLNFPEYTVFDSSR